MNNLFNFLGQTEREDLQVQCLELLSMKIQQYTRGESSSIKVEKAQSIMQSILYTIEMSINKAPEENALLVMESRPLSQLYDEGLKIIENKLSGARILLEKARLIRVITDNVAYNDTLDQGLESFFTDYDMDFSAHETSASIDYPISRDNFDLTGVEYIYNYLQCLVMENEFCSNFSKKEISRLLSGLHQNSCDLLINIFNLVLTNLTGRILAGKDTSCLELCPVDLQYLQQNLESLDRIELGELLNGAAVRLCSDYKVSEALKQHMYNAIINILPQLANSLKIKRLEQVFIIPRRHDKSSTVEYSQHSSMADEHFRAVTEEIRSCRFTEDKIGIIKKEAHSIGDFMDILEAGCLFEEEFSHLFSSLGNLELAVLSTQLPDLGDDLNYQFSQGEKEWKMHLLRYLEEVGPAVNNEVEALRKKIDTRSL